MFRVWQPCSPNWGRGGSPLGPCSSGLLIGHLPVTDTGLPGERLMLFYLFFFKRYKRLIRHQAAPRITSYTVKNGHFPPFATVFPPIRDGKKRPFPPIRDGTNPPFATVRIPHSRRYARPQTPHSRRYDRKAEKDLLARDFQDFPPFATVSIKSESPIRDGMTAQMNKKCVPGEVFAVLRLGRVRVLC